MTRRLDLHRTGSTFVDRPASALLGLAGGLASLAVCGAVIPSAAAATSLLAGFGSPVYLEDYSGEAVFPTTPETDSLGLGGLLGGAFGNGPPLAPALTGSDAAFDATSTGFAGGPLPAETALVAGGGASISSDVAVQAQYDSYTLTAVGNSQTFAGVFLQTAPLPGGLQLTA